MPVLKNDRRISDRMGGFKGQAMAGGMRGCPDAPDL